MSPFSRFAIYFAEVARSGSLRRAAEKLHISASAINRQILQAEEAFGTPLFERLPEGLRMTTAGELLYDNLLRWQKEFHLTRQKFDELQGLKRGSVSLGMVQALAEGSFAAALAEDTGLEDLKAKGTFVMGFDEEYPPMGFVDENGEYVGFDIDLANAIGEKTGMQVEVKSLGFDALIPALRSGQIDMIASGMDATPERQKQVSFTEPYFQDGYSVVVRKDNTNINGFDDLKGRTVGSQVGTKGVDLATEAGATVKQYDANSQGWMELQSGTCDAVVINTSVALYYMKEGGDKDLKIVGDAKKADAGIAMAVSKDKPELLEKVNKALADLKADGTYAKLYKKWFGVDPKA